MNVEPVESEQHDVEMILPSHVLYWNHLKSIVCEHGVIAARKLHQLGSESRLDNFWRTILLGLKLARSLSCRQLGRRKS